MELRQYQKQLAEHGARIAREHGFVYLAMEMRVGKTAISLAIARQLKKDGNILFVSKKKALPSIQADADAMEVKNITITNYEQLSKITEHPAIVVIDEAHSIGQYPKPNLRCRELRRIISSGETTVIYLSGTPTPETYSQIYFQFSVLGAVSPFSHYKNFYYWARDFVDIREKYINGYRIKDYSGAKIDKIEKVLRQYRLTYTQQEAGFSSEIEEEIVTVEMPHTLQWLIQKIKMDGYYKFKDGTEIVADSAVKLMGKIHQISSGTVITETGETKILSTYKADYIKKMYGDKKIAIYYKFIAEGEMLRQAFPDATTSPEEFNDSEERKVFISQIQSGSMGINLSTADILLFFNIDFSATQYYQARARLGAMDREHAQLIHWIFSDVGLEKQVYRAVQKKKSYTVSHYRRENQRGQNRIRFAAAMY